MSAKILHSTITHSNRINLIDAVGLLQNNFDNRLLLSTLFTPEDQVLTHFIFKNNLPVRVFTAVSENHFDILLRTVEHYGKNIEVSFQQTLLASAAFASAFPEKYEQLNINPLSAPLSQLLTGRHVIISGRRRDQFADPHAARPFIWDEAQRVFRYYPLFYWTAADIESIIIQENIPYEKGSLPVSKVAVLRWPRVKWSVVFRGIYNRFSPARTAISAAFPSKFFVPATFLPLQGIKA